MSDDPMTTTEIDETTAELIAELIYWKKLAIDGWAKEYIPDTITGTNVVEGETGSSNAEIAALRQDAARLRLVERDLRNQIEAQRLQIEEIKNSSSWRYSRPIRIAGALMKGGSGA